MTERKQEASVTDDGGGDCLHSIKSRHLNLTLDLIFEPVSILASTVILFLADRSETWFTEALFCSIHL